MRICRADEEIIATIEMFGDNSVLRCCLSFSRKPSCMMFGIRIFDDLYSFPIVGGVRRNISAKLREQWKFKTSVSLKFEKSTTIDISRWVNFRKFSFFERLDEIGL